LVYNQFVAGIRGVPGGFQPSLVHPPATRI